MAAGPLTPTMAVGLNTYLNSSCRNEIAWHPNGDVLAIPGRKNGVDVIMYGRDTGEKVFSLKGRHSVTIGFLAWSPNGKYLATAAGDNQIILWDLDNRQDIDSEKFEAQICSLAWKPKGNALAGIDSDIKFGVWERGVPAHMTLPSDNSIQPSAIDREELLRLSDDDEEVLNENENKSSSQEKEKSLSPIVAHKSFKQKGTEQDSSAYKKSKSQPQSKDLSSFCGVVWCLGLPCKKLSKSCSTRIDFGIRHFLTYNLIGSVTSCQTEGLAHI